MSAVRGSFISGYAARIVGAIPVLVILCTAMSRTHASELQVCVALAVTLGYFAIPLRDALAFGQLLVTAAVMAPPLIWLRNLEDAPIPTVSVGVLVVPFLLVRRAWRKPIMGPLPDECMVIVALLVIAFDAPPTAFIPFAIIALLALLVHRQTTAGFFATARTQPRAYALGFVFAACVAFAGGGTLKYGYAQFRGSFRGFAGYTDPRVGYADAVRLDGGGIAQSDAVALRVYGDQPQYLQGAIFNEFDGTKWIDGKSAVPLTEVPLPSHELPARVVAIDAEHRVFAPFGADVWGQGGIARTGSGSLQSTAKRGATEWRYGPGTANMPPPVTERDLMVPASLAVDLKRLATRWTLGAQTDLQRALRIERHLRTECRYSLDADAHKYGTGLRAFLFQDCIGHCEYFASAMAMLLRSIGIPSRVVAGYAVHERNPYGNFSTVRSSDAHAWVIATTAPGTTAGQPAQFELYDPTPSVQVDSAPSRIRGLIEYMRERLGAAYDAIVEKPLLAAIPLGAIAALLLLYRWWRLRKGAVATVEASERLFDACMAALEKSGFVREDTETLHEFSERITRTNGAPLSPQLPAALRSVAVARLYGSLEERMQQAQSLLLLAKQLKSRR
jgi:hypothetical protein